MPRGFKRDEAATREAKFLDKRSFVSLPKFIEGEPDLPLWPGRPLGAHLILYGKDKAPIRAEIFRRNREENGGFNRCFKCGNSVREFGQGAQKGEWDHVRNRPGERCDCIENSRVACRQCHSERHPKPWG